MIRVVFDSNVYISSLLFGGNPRLIMQLGEAGVVDLCTSDPIRAEVEGVLRRKFYWADDRIEGDLNYVWSLTRSVAPRRVVRDCRDSMDNRVLECALEANAGWIVTGDQDLLVLHPYRDIKIVTPRQFLASQVWRTEK